MMGRLLMLYGMQLFVPMMRLYYCVPSYFYLIRKEGKLEMLDRRVKEDRVISACKRMVANELNGQGVSTTDTLIVLYEKPIVDWDILQFLKDGAIELPTRGRLPRQLKYVWSVKGWDNQRVDKAVELLAHPQFK